MPWWRSEGEKAEDRRDELCAWASRLPTSTAGNIQRQPGMDWVLVVRQVQSLLPLAATDDFPPDSTPSFHGNPPPRPF